MRHANDASARPARGGGLIRRALRRLGWGLLALVLVGGAYVTVQRHRHPSLQAYSSYVAPLAPRDAPVRVRFAGVATLLFDDGETAWMTDGFFSRPGMLQTLCCRIAPEPEIIARELKRLGVQRLAAVVPVHSHYDHALDAAAVAQSTGALLLGSASTLNLGRGAGLAESQMREVRDGDTIQFGKFAVTFIASRHSPTLYSDGVSVELITTPVVPPARATAWREGVVWSLLVAHASGARYLVQGSAGFIPGALQGRHADTVFLGVGALDQKTPEYREAYWNEVVRAVGAKRVVVIHWDDFWLPLDQPLQAMPLLFGDLRVSMDDLLAHGARDGVQIQLPPAFDPFVP